MTKPLVERYEQILAQDPASTAFVELAKALLARGDFGRAIEVCQQGLSHHKDSVVGRVLWGKALIQLSRPAEAMEQFDQAIAIDRENPHAYNLIGEVLLHKQLYRSALPILKKAMALQPNDMRVRQWLEQTQRALSGSGPAPVVADPTLPDTAALESSAPDITAPNPSHPELPAAQPENPTAVTAPNPSHPELPAQRASNPGIPALRPSNPELAAQRASNPGLPAQRASNPGIPVLRPSGPPPLDAPTQSNPAITAPTVIEESSALAAALEPSAGAPTREVTQPSGATDDDDEDKTDPLATVDGPRGSFRLPPPSLDPVTVAGTVPELPPVKPAAPSSSRDEPTVALSQDLLADLAQESQPPRKPPKRELLDVVAPTEEQLPIIAPRPPPQLRGTPPGPPRPPPLSSSGAKKQLLTELPAEPSPTVPLELPKVELSPVAAQAIAQEYERELREELAEKAVSKNESLFARHGLKLAAALGVVVVLGVGAVAFLQTRAANRGQDLHTALALAKKGLAQDTAQSYREALESLEVALKMSSGSAEAWALSAQAHAVLFAEHGASGEHRQQAELALSKPGVETGFPAQALMARYLVANGSGRDAARKAVVESRLDAAEVHLLAGQLLLGKGDSRGALERFKKASELAPHSARTLVALGEYYREAGDCPRALGFYATAAQVSPHHPIRAVGSAECRLELSVELPEALKEVEELKEVEALPPDLLARQALAQGRLLSAAGRHGEAVKRLSEGARGFGTRAYDFNLALGDARKASADMAGAQEALEAAVKARPKSEEARAALARVLLARDRERDALGRLTDVEGRKVALVRGAIYGRLGDWKRARAELAKTQIDGKYPAEAVVYLGLADLAEGNEERAQEALERALGSARRFKAEIRVALAQVYWKRGALEKAKVQFAEAAKEPLDYEGACGLGRMLRAQGEIEAALDPLSKAAVRNPSHGEARSALVRSYLDLNRVNEALAQAQAWEKDSPESALAQRDHAFALHHAGKEKEAEAASKRAVKLNGDDPEAYRVRAEILFTLGDSKDAFAALEAANKRDPKDPETFCAIGHAFLRGGKGDNAEKAFEAALRNDEKSACGRIGLQLAKLPGGAKAAVKELPELAKGAARPWERALAWATLARAELALGNANQARKAAEQAVQLAPLSGEAQLARGLVAVRQRDEATARSALEKAAEREPAHAGVHLALGDLLSRSEAELDRARQAYEAYLRFGGEPAEQARVKKALTTLKKRLAAR